MSVEITDPYAKAAFLGTRGGLFAMLFRGYLLMVPTIGIYRFWLVTKKRRYFWHNTPIDGDRLEYTGTAKQLFIGFLIALAVFLPLQLLVIFASTISPIVGAIVPFVVITLYYLLIGYVIYRARRFRLTRTLWRGIRFHQTGSAWNYAFRRFGWSLLVVITLGLAYPFMVADLWRYRYNNTWYGNQQFAFHGTWRTIAGPFFRAHVGNIVFLLVSAYLAFFTFAIPVPLEDRTIPNFQLVAIASAIFMILLFLSWVYISARTTSRMLSSVTIGDASLRVRIRARSLTGMYLVYVFLLALVGLLFGLGLFATGLTELVAEPTNIQASSGPIVMIVGLVIYVAFIGASAMVSELILGFGYWRLVVQGTEIFNARGLRNVRALGEESSVVGEGMADALDIGAF